MSARPISVRKLKEILRCKYQGRLTHRQIALSLNISASTVSYYVNRAAQLGITDWPLTQLWDDVTLERAFLKTVAVHKTQHKPLPNWAGVYQELKAPGRKGVTLELLWQEYAERSPEQHYSYNLFIKSGRPYCSPLCDKLIWREPSGSDTEQQDTEQQARLARVCFFWDLRGHPLASRC